MFMKIINFIVLSLQVYFSLNPNKKLMLHPIKKSMFLILIITTLTATAQDTTFFDNHFQKIRSLENCEFYVVSFKGSPEANKTTERVFSKSGQIQSDQIFLSPSNNQVQGNKIYDGKFKTWYKNGLLHEDIDYSIGKKNGKLLTYWETGIHKREDIFIEGKLSSGKCFNISGNDTSYYAYESVPQFPGGIEKYKAYLINGLSSAGNTTEGIVMVQFAIAKDGSIINIKVVQSANEDLDKKAVAIIEKMPHWIPAYQDGLPKIYTQRQGITFKK